MHCICTAYRLKHKCQPTATAPTRCAQLLIRKFAQIRYRQSKPDGKHHSNIAWQLPSIFDDLARSVLPDVARWFKEQVERWRGRQGSGRVQPEPVIAVNQTLPPPERSDPSDALKPADCSAGGKLSHGGRRDTRSNGSLLRVVEEDVLEGFVKPRPSVAIHVVQGSTGRSYRRETLQALLQQQALRATGCAGNAHGGGGGKDAENGGGSGDALKGGGSLQGRALAAWVVDSTEVERLATQATERLFSILKTRVFVRYGLSCTVARYCASWHVEE